MAERDLFDEYYEDQDDVTKDFISQDPVVNEVKRETDPFDDYYEEKQLAISPSTPLEPQDLARRFPIPKMDRLLEERGAELLVPNFNAIKLQQRFEEQDARGFGELFERFANQFEFTTEKMAEADLVASRAYGLIDLDPLSLQAKRNEMRQGVDDINGLTRRQLRTMYLDSKPKELRDVVDPQLPIHAQYERLLEEGFFSEVTAPGTDLGVTQTLFEAALIAEKSFDELTFPLRRDFFKTLDNDKLLKHLLRGDGSFRKRLEAEEALPAGVRRDALDESVDSAGNITPTMIRTLFRSGTTVGAAAGATYLGGEVVGRLMHLPRGTGRKVVGAALPYYAKVALWGNTAYLETGFNTMDFLDYEGPNGEKLDFETALMFGKVTGAISGFVDMLQFGTMKRTAGRPFRVDVKKLLLREDMQKLIAGMGKDTAENVVQENIQQLTPIIAKHMQAEMQFGEKMTPESRRAAINELIETTVSVTQGMPFISGLLQTPGMVTLAARGGLQAAVKERKSLERFSRIVTDELMERHPNGGWGLKAGVEPTRENVIRFAAKSGKITLKQAESTMRIVDNIVKGENQRNGTDLSTDEWLAKKLATGTPEEVINGQQRTLTVNSRESNHAVIQSKIRSKLLHSHAFSNLSDDDQRGVTHQVLGLLADTDLNADRRTFERGIEALRRRLGDEDPTIQALEKNYGKLGEQLEMFHSEQQDGDYVQPTPDNAEELFDVSRINLKFVSNLSDVLFGKRDFTTEQSFSGAKGNVETGIYMLARALEIKVGGRKETNTALLRGIHETAQYVRDITSRRADAETVGLTQIEGTEGLISPGRGGHPTTEIVNSIIYAIAARNVDKRLGPNATTMDRNNAVNEEARIVSAEEVLRELEELQETSARMASALESVPVYNKLQMLSKKLAIQMANMDYDGAHTTAIQLENYVTPYMRSDAASEGYAKTEHLTVAPGGHIGGGVFDVAAVLGVEFDASATEEDIAYAVESRRKELAKSEIMIILDKRNPLRPQFRVVSNPQGGTAETLSIHNSRYAAEQAKGELTDVIAGTGPYSLDSAYTDPNTGTRTVHGSITFLEDGRHILNLFDTAHAGTFLHEMAHIFLRGLSDADAEVLADEFAYVTAKPGGIKPQFEWAKKIIKKHQTGERLSAGEKAALILMQEKFASRFTAFVMEGKAPNQSLKDVFHHFRIWLTSMYQTKKELLQDIVDVESLDPDVRYAFKANGYRTSETSIPPEIEVLFRQILTSDETIESGYIRGSAGKVYPVRMRGRSAIVEVPLVDVLSRINARILKEAKKRNPNGDRLQALQNLKKKNGWDVGNPEGRYVEAVVTEFIKNEVMSGSKQNFLNAVFGANFKWEVKQTSQRELDLDFDFQTKQIEIEQLPDSELNRLAGKLGLKTRLNKNLKGSQREAVRGNLVSMIHQVQDSLYMVRNPIISEFSDDQHFLHNAARLLANLGEEGTRLFWREFFPSHIDNIKNSPGEVSQLQKEVGEAGERIASTQKIRKGDFRIDKERVQKLTRLSVQVSEKIRTVVDGLVTPIYPIGPDKDHPIAYLTKFEVWAQPEIYPEYTTASKEFALTDEEQVIMDAWYALAGSTGLAAEKAKLQNYERSNDGRLVNPVPFLADRHPPGANDPPGTRGAIRGHKYARQYTEDMLSIIAALDDSGRRVLAQALAILNPGKFSFETALEQVEVMHRDRRTRHIGMEVLRSIPRIPTHISVPVRVGKKQIIQKRISILESEPFILAEKLTNHTANRLGFVEEMRKIKAMDIDPQSSNDLNKLIEDFSATGRNESEKQERRQNIINFIKTANGLPISDVGLFMPGTPEFYGHELYKGASVIWKAKVLGKAVWRNIFETLNNVPPEFGLPRFLTALASIGWAGTKDLFSAPIVWGKKLTGDKEAHFIYLAELNRLSLSAGARSRMLANFVIRKDRAIRDFVNAYGNDLLVFTLLTKANEMNEFISAVTAAQFVKDLENKRVGEFGRETLRRLRFTDSEVANFMAGRMSDQDKKAIINRTTALAEGTNLQPIELSRFQSRPWAKDMLAFWSYQRKTVRRFSETASRIAEVSKRGSEATGMEKFLAWDRLVELSFGHTMGGAAGTLLRNMVHYGPAGVLFLLWDDDDDGDPDLERLSAFLAESFLAASFSGWFEGITYNWGRGVRSPLQLIVQSTVPSGMFMEVGDVIGLRGAYKNRTYLGAVYKYMTTVTTAQDTATAMWSIFGLGARDTELDFAIKQFYKYKRGGGGYAENENVRFRNEMRQIHELIRRKDFKDENDLIKWHKEIDAHLASAFNYREEDYKKDRMAKILSSIQGKKLWTKVPLDQREEMQKKLTLNERQKIQEHDYLLDMLAEYIKRDKKRIFK